MTMTNYGYPESPAKALKATAPNKLVPFRTFLHYSDPDAGKQITVFGCAKRGMFYNYSDRICGQKWTEGCELANQSRVPANSARWFEIALNHFHDTDDVDLQHVMLACNRSNGFSYLIFGYSYTKKQQQ